MHHMDTNKTHWEKGKWGITQECCFCLEQILKPTPPEQLLYGHLPPISQTPQLRWTRCGALQDLEKQGRTHKQHSFMDSCTQTYQCWLSNKDLLRSALYGHRMQPWKPAKEQWMIEMDGKRESRKYALSAQLDDNNCLVLLLITRNYITVCKQMTIIKLK